MYKLLLYHEMIQNNFQLSRNQKLLIKSNRNDQKEIGKNKARQPFKSGFEAEDSLYILPIITYYKLEYYFITAAAIGAPIFYFFVIRSYLILKK